MMLYNTATWFLAIVVAIMLVAIPILFPHGQPGQRSANLPGKDYEGRISDGMRASPGLPNKEFK